MRSLVARKQIVALLALLFVAALVPRLIGIDWHGWNPDESPGTPARILAGEFVVASYYPPLLYYVHAVSLAITYAIGRILGWWHSTADLRALYYVDKTVFLVSGRIVCAIFAALLAPAAALIARELRLSWASAIAIGMLAVLVPGEIFWAHIAKSDVGLAASFLLVLLPAFRLLREPRSTRDRILLALAVAYSVSLKQSAIFYLAPALAMILIASLLDRRRRSDSLKAWGVAILIAIPVWAVLNVGIIAKPSAFIEAQRVQTQMSFRDATPAQTIATFLETMKGWQGGMPLAALILCPVLIVAGLIVSRGETRLRLAVMTIAWIIAVIVIGRIGGSRQPGHLIMPYATILLLLAGLSAGMLADRMGLARGLGWLALAALAIACLMRLPTMLGQFLAPPTADRLAAHILAHVPPGSRVLTAAPIGKAVTLSPIGPGEERERQERLAARYGVAMPPSTTPPLPDAPGAYIVRNFPFAMGGMENTPENSKVRMAFAWPPQHDEWRLDYWLARDTHWFLFAPDFLAPSVTPIYLAMFQDIVRRCRLVDRVDTERPLLGEQRALLYHCP